MNRQSPWARKLYLQNHERPISSHTYDMLALHGGYLYTLKRCRRAVQGMFAHMAGARTLLAAYQRLQRMGWPTTLGSLRTAVWAPCLPRGKEEIRVQVVVGDTACIIGSSYGHL